MKKFYNYVVYPQGSHSNFTLDEPFSSMLVSTIEQAYKWAERLLTFNTSATSVNFRSENGWKLYYIIRKNGKLIRGKID